MYDANLYQHFYGVRIVGPKNKKAAEKLKRNNLSSVTKSIVGHYSDPVKDSVPVYFEQIGKRIPITLRFFDRLLNDNSLVCIQKKWIVVD